MQTEAHAVRGFLYPIAHTDQGLFSILDIGTDSFYVCELPWQGNRPLVSCIPGGTYTVVRDMTTDNHNWWKVLNVPGRRDIELHVGNTIADTEGCLLVGNALGTLDERWAVLDSQAGMQRLHNALDAVDFWTLEVHRGMAFPPPLKYYSAPELEL